MPSPIPLPRLVAAILFVSLIGGAAWAPSPSRTQPPVDAPATLSAFRGTYVLAGDARELRAMDQAIDRVVDQLNLFIREIARGEIHRRVTPEQRIVLEVFDLERITLAMDDWGPVAVTLGAAPRRIRGRSGDDERLTVRLHEGRLVAQTLASGGSRTSTFALSSDAERLQMHVRIASGQLPADIRYSLTYRRAD